MDFTFKYQVKDSTNLSFMFHLSPDGVGCNKCFSPDAADCQNCASYVAVHEPLSKYFCTFSTYLQNGSFPAGSKLIPNCINYGILEGTLICKVCSLNYIPSTNGKCYLASTQAQCLELDGPTLCGKCKNDYVIVEGSCQKKNIENCLEYVEKTDKNKQECKTCIAEHYLTEEGLCVKGIVSNCEKNSSEKLCTKCKNGFFEVKIKNN